LTNFLLFTIVVPHSTCFKY